MNHEHDDDDDDDKALLGELRALDARPEPDARRWQAMADGVRAGYQRARTARRRRWRVSAAATSALALAAVLLLWLRPHPRPHGHALDLMDDVPVLGDELGPGEELEEMDPALLERIDAAFKKGA